MNRLVVYAKHLPVAARRAQRNAIVTVSNAKHMIQHDPMWEKYKTDAPLFLKKGPDYSFAAELAVLIIGFTGYTIVWDMYKNSKMAMPSQEIPVKKEDYVKPTKINTQMDDEPVHVNRGAHSQLMKYGDNWYTGNYSAAVAFEREHGKKKKENG